MSNLYRKPCKPGVLGINDYYTKPEVNELLAAKASLSSVYTKTQIDSLLAALEVGGVTDGDKGDILVSGLGSTWSIKGQVVEFGNIQDVQADVLLGRADIGTGPVTEITCTAAGRALLDDVNAAAQRTTLGLGTLATQDGTFSGTSSGTNTGDQTITLTGDVTGSGTGTFAATISNNAVTFPKIQNVNTAVLLGRFNTGIGNVEEVTLGSGLSLSGLGVLNASLSLSLNTTSITVTVAPGATASSTITLPKTFIIVAMEVNKACWVRIYAKNATVALDASRTRAQSPQRNIGVIADPVFVGAEKIWWDPAESYGNQEDPRTNTYPVKVTNDGETSDVTLTIYYYTLES